MKYLEYSESANGVDVDSDEDDNRDSLNIKELLLDLLEEHGNIFKGYFHIWRLILFD